MDDQQIKQPTTTANNAANTGINSPNNQDPQSVPSNSKVVSSIPPKPVNTGKDTLNSSFASRFGSSSFGSASVPPKPKDAHQENFELLKTNLGENRVKEYEPMSKHTTFRIGGPAEFYFEAESIEDFIRAITICRQDKFLKNPEDITEDDSKRVAELEKQKGKSTPKPASPYGLGRSPFGSKLGGKKESRYFLPSFILGGGSNILVSDRGVQGLTIKVKASKINFGGDIVEAYAGTPTGYLLQKVLDTDLTGMEFLNGVPGTIGGAVINNAKSFFLGQFLKNPKSISEIIYDLTVMTKEGKVMTRNVSDYEWGLTHNNISENGDIILVVRFKLQKGLSKEAEQYLKEYNAVRHQKPYMKYPSAGSIFRNPEGMSAGKLIDECGLKGEKRGEAQISEEHGNIFINLGNAKAVEVRELINLAKEKVLQKFNISLQEEIRYIGDYRSDAEIAAIKEKNSEKDNQLDNENSNQD